MVHHHRPQGCSHIVHMQKLQRMNISAMARHESHAALHLPLLESVGARARSASDKARRNPIGGNVRFNLNGGV
jgi:hypothetical protein